MWPRVVIGWCAHKLDRRGAKISIISLSLKTECLFTFEWLTFIRQTFNTVLRCCRVATASCGNVSRSWSTKACRWELVEVTEVQEVRLSLSRFIKVHINPPHFIVLFIEIAKWADKLQYFTFFDLVHSFPRYPLPKSPILHSRREIAEIVFDTLRA